MTLKSDQESQRCLPALGRDLQEACKVAPPSITQLSGLSQGAAAQTLEFQRGAAYSQDADPVAGEQPGRQAAGNQGPICPDSGLLPTVCLVDPGQNQIEREMRYRDTSFHQHVQKVRYIAVA